MAKNWKRKTERVLREYRDLQRHYILVIAEREQEKRRAGRLQFALVAVTAAFVIELIAGVL